MLWQFIITSEMIGLEANIAMEVIFMIANLQTLGVPIRYTSLPGTVAAAASFFLIPCLGFVLDRWAKSKQSKAKILAFTTMLQLLGSLLVLLANGLKVWMSPGADYFGLNRPNGENFTLLLRLESAIKAGYNSTSSREISHYITSHPEELLNQSHSIISPQKLQHQSFLLHTSITFPFDSPFNSSIQHPLLLLNTSMEMPYMPVEASSSVPIALQQDSAEDTLPFYTYIAMIGYTLVDCGYDSSNCFLKTFVLHCTPKEYHRSALIKCIMVASMGKYPVSVRASQINAQSY